jgi:predicted HAD superfamily Cof-like phosphohydrolase
MDETLRGVMLFHRTFNQPVRESPTMPALSAAERTDLGAIALLMEQTSAVCLYEAERTLGRSAAHDAYIRLQLLQEELSELARALQEEDLVSALDALTDIQYVLDGTYLVLGLHYHKQAAFQEVQHSNLTKLDENGKPLFNEAGRVKKGPKYEPPDLQRVLREVL